MKIYTVEDLEFKSYGQLLQVDTAAIISVANTLKRPNEGSEYRASVPELEKTEIYNTMQKEIFGEMPIQIGICHGHSYQLNALEWHKSSEINIAGTDQILFLGKLDEIDENGRFHAEKIKAFLLKKGQCIEIYATTLHFCPVETDKNGFSNMVVLPKGTNTDLEHAPENKLLFRKNKWLIAHEDNQTLLQKGVIGAIYGENYDVRTIL